MAKGKLIVLEGADGTGKSTHARLLSEHLLARGYNTVVTEEPTKGEIGGFIRSVLSGKKKVSPEALALLFTADRAEHIENVIKPAIESGKIVITDRYYYSTVAYQSVQGLSQKWLSEINSFAIEPDIVIALEIESKEALSRMNRETKEVFEYLDFQEKVQKELLGMAKAAGKGLSKPGKAWAVISTSAPREEVHKRIAGFVDSKL